MGRLWVAAVECNYQEVDRQLKEQFIHGLNDKMYVRGNNKGINSNKKQSPYNKWRCVNMGKRVGAQRAKQQY